MAVNGKNKGNSFERKISKILSDRFANFTGKTMSFRRNADSGSFFGGRNQRRTESHDLSKAEFGDIVTPSNFKFSVECKHYKTPPSFSSILDQDCKMLDEWIKKVEQDAKNSGREPCIVMKFNNVKECVVVNPSAIKVKSKTHERVKPVMIYKDYFIIPINNFLNQEDSWFFINS